MKSIGKIVVMMYLFTTLLLFLLAAMLQRFQLQDGTISIGIGAVYVISCGFGGFFAGKVQRNRRFLWGLLAAVIYVLILMGLTLLLKKQVDGTGVQLLINFVLCLGAGMLGGMLS